MSTDSSKKEKEPHARKKSSPPKQAAAGGRKKAGVPVSREELREAFEFFDVQHNGFITQQDLKSRLSVFYKSLNPREYKFLMNNQPQITQEDLYNLLSQNELRNFDPVAEAFKIYDPQGTGYVDMEVLKEILCNLGLGKLSALDVQILLDTADCDGDGLISLEDFRNMLSKREEKPADSKTDPKTGKQLSDKTDKSAEKEKASPSTADRSALSTASSGTRPPSP